VRDAFLDTVGLIAVWDTADQWHAAADDSYRRLLSRRQRLVTTGPILLECGNVAARRPYRPRVNELRLALMAERLLIVPTPEDLGTAWAACDRGDPGQAGIVDHVSFSVMRRLGIAEAFTNDRHFRAEGFATLF